jgi:hypothetical protein
MSEAADMKIAQLEGELIAAQELLVGAVLGHGGPIVFKVSELRELIKGQDHMLNADLNTDTDEVTLSIVEVPDGQ